MINCPERIESYLKTLYGDYMKLPSSEKQVSHHSFYIVKEREEN